MLRRLREHDQIDWERASLDAASVSSPRGGQETGPNPTERGKRGSKRHIVVDARGIPLAVTVTGADRHDSAERGQLAVEHSPFEGVSVAEVLDADLPLGLLCRCQSKLPHRVQSLILTEEAISIALIRNVTVAVRLDAARQAKIYRRTPSVAQLGGTFV
jgi:hypothetical protein